MFFEITLLCPQHKGKFATVWIAATRGVDKLVKKQILDVNVIDICQEITSMYVTLSHKPQERLSLSLTAKLVNGTIKIFRKQVALLQESVFQCFTIPSTIFLKPQRAVGTKKKLHKSRTVHSDEIIHSEEIVPQVQETTPVEYLVQLDITDRDVEKALLEQPTAHVDTITLREEVSTRLTHDEENLFGDEGFIESQRFLLERGPPLTETDRIEFEERVSRDISRIGSQAEVEQVHVPLIEREPAIRVDLEKIMMVEETQQVQEKSAPVEPPPKKRLRTDVKKLEMLEKKKKQKDAQELLMPTPEEIVQEPVTPRRKINLEKATVKLNSKFRNIKVRCDDEDLEIFTMAVYTAINIEKFVNILDECQDMLIYSSQETSFEGVRRQEGSTMSHGTGSRSRLTRLSQDTPTLARPSGGMLEEVIDSREPRVIRQQLSGRKSQTPEVEVPTIIAAPVSPTLKTTDIQERESAILETIIEDVPPAAFAIAREPIVSVVTDAVPKLIPEEHKKNVKSRQRKIICLVRDWDFSTRDLTIEDIAEKPLNRIHMAVAFNDLMNLRKLQYVKLSKKENSLELDKIEKGARLL